MIHGHNQQLYIDILSNNEIIKKDYEEKQQKEKKPYVQKMSKEEKSILLLEYVQINGKTPPKEYVDIKSGENIGHFFHNIKQGSGKRIYTGILSENEIIKKEYERFLDKREKEKNKDKFTPEEKAYMLIKYVEENKKICPSNYKIPENSVRLGSFFSIIKNNNHKLIYKNILSKNEIIKKEYEKFQVLRENNKTKIKYSPEEKAYMILDYVEKNGEIFNSTYEDPITEVKLGIFFNGIKQGNYKELYENILSTNEIIKNEYEKIQVLKETRENTVQYSIEEKCFMLIKYVEENKKPPTKSYEDKETGVQLGNFFDRVKQGYIPKYYTEILSKNKIIKKEYDRFQNK